MFLVNSRLGSFAAAPSARVQDPSHRRHPFSRSYGVVLPSSLTGVLSRALGFSPRLPVSVCGTGTGNLARGFSRQYGIGPFATYNFAPHHVSGFTCGGFAYRTSYTLGPGLPSPGGTYPSASPHCSNGDAVVQEYQPVVHRLRLSAST